MLDGVIDRGLADELHHHAALGQRRDLVDQGAVLVAAPPVAQRVDRGEPRDGNGLKLIGRRRRPELDAQRALGGKHRGLPAHLPLGELSLAARAYARADQQRGGSSLTGALNRRRVRSAAPPARRGPC